VEQTASNSSLAKFIVITGLVALLYGVCAGLFILREPDTCFLLAMGKWIYEHQIIPTNDPFSYTFTLYPQPLGLVVYQWLTELIFFSVYKFGGIISLQLFGCSILVLSFFVIPWHILNSFSLGSLRVSIIILWLVLGTVDRILLKPEIFSYLFLSLFILVMVKNEIKAERTVNSKQIVILSIIMLLWANLHSGFVIGIILTLVLALRDLFFFTYTKFFKNQQASLVLNWIFSFIGCLIASFFTPSGIRLWQYIPHLYFHPVNHYIVELQPLSLTTAIHNLPLLISFFGLSIFSILQIIRKLHTDLNKSDLVYIVITLTGIVLAFTHLRMITFALLLMLPLIASGFSIKDSLNGLGKFSTKINILVFVCAFFGCTIISLFNNPTIPTAAKAFMPPFDALKYIAAHNLKGNLLNDPTFGDVLMWNMENPPPLFLDTRFDAYPWQITKDYVAFRNGKENWQSILQRYNINWIFIPANSPVCVQLSKQNSWHSIYKDDVAQIFTSE
jgi:hypothetical protein